MRLGRRFYERVEASVKESKHIEFKEMFDEASSHDWCEIVKDIVAIANSGGGCILIGVRNDGSSVQIETDFINKLDSAKFMDKIFRYTGEKLISLDIKKINRNDGEAIGLFIDGSNIPKVFHRPGTYDIGGGQQTTAFKEGTVYFRHGAKSEPATSDDIRDAIEREIDRRRRSLVGNLRKVIEAPPDHIIQVVPERLSGVSSIGVSSVRYTNDPRAPAVRYQTPDDEHPYRQRNVIRLFNERLVGKKSINAHDLLCVRRIHKIDSSKPQYYYKSLTGSPQYSQEFVEWIIKSYCGDNNFFEKARIAYSKLSLL